MSDFRPFQDPHLERLRSRLEAIEPRTRAVLQGLSAEAMLRRPPSGGWSIAEVLEHLCLSHDLYLDRHLPAVVARARARKPPLRPFAPSLVGRFLLSAMREVNRNRFPTTRALSVRAAVRDGAAEAFLASVHRIEALMREADGHDLTVSFRSPVAPIVPLRLGDAFAVLIEHAHRHLAQAERVREATGG